MPTITRKLRLALSEVLRAAEIDDLKLEIDLVSAIKQVAPELFGQEQPQGAAAALAAHEERAAQVDQRLDTSHFPADVQAVVAHVCELWSLLPPKKRKRGGEYAAWIEASRALQDACGDIDPQAVITALREDYVARSNENQGMTPYTVSGPVSLVKMCRATAGLLREKERNYANASTGHQSSFDF